MKINTKHFIFLAAILTINCHAQISFDKGYFINDNNQKIICQIKNMDWKNNPTEFDYRLSEYSELKKENIKSVKEFVIDNNSKYIKATVDIDRSSSNIMNISTKSNPIFNREVLFLKVLVEGKSNLYEYYDGGLIRYFYTYENSNIQQLIFKPYLDDENNIIKNNTYKQQLWTNLKCAGFEISKIEKVDYNKSDLVRFFTEYSKCHNYDLVYFEQKQKKDLFNLTIRPRINSSSLTIQNSIDNSQDINFDNEIGFGFGLETEFILPFNKNKWSIILEPSYQNFKSQKTSYSTNVSGGIFIAKADYSSIEIPVSIRHYLYL